MQTKILENNHLFKECIEALGINLLSQEESDSLTKVFEQLYPFTRWGKVNWNEVDCKIDLHGDQNNIIPALTKLLNTPIVDTTAYIEWSDGSLPIIKTNLEDIILHFNDVISVPFEQFIFNPYMGYIIEILPSGHIMAGIVEPLCKETA